MKALTDCHLYGILDTGYIVQKDAVRIAKEMITGGVDIIQLRAKNLDEYAIQDLAAEIVAVTEPAGIPFIVNDYPELVPAIGATGAHVGQDDRAVEDARWRAGRALADELEPPIIGKSTHAVRQAVAAEAEGADYIGFGPLFATPTKPDYKPIGLEDIAKVHELVKIPIFCIGGIKRENLASVVAAGARRVVIVSGILTATDIVGYCREVKAMLPVA